MALCNQAPTFDRGHADRSVWHHPGRWLCLLLSVLWLACTPQSPPSSLAKLGLTSEEAAWLTAHPVITYSHDPAYPPFDFLGSRGQHDGLSADFLRLTGQALGKGFVRVPSENWDRLLSNLREGKVDFVTGIVRTEEREQYAVFTEPYFTVKTVFVGRAGQADVQGNGSLKGRRVFVSRGFAVVEYLLKNYADIVLEYVNDDQTGITRLALGEGDYAVSDLPVLTHTIRQEGLTNLRIAGYTGFEYPLRFAASRKSPELAGILDKAFGSISPAQREMLVKKWISMEDKRFYAYKEFWIALASGVLILASLFVSNRLLQRTVDRRTADLQGELERRTAAEAALRASERNYRQLFETAVEGIYQSTPEGRILSANPAFARILGYEKPEALLGDFNAYRMYVLPSARDDWNRILQKDGFVEGFEFEAFRKDGTIVRFSDTSQAVRDEQGELLYYQGVLEDITEKRRAEELRLAKEAAEAANAAKSEFLANMSHEIRTPLNSILGFSELLESESMDAQARHYVASIRSAGRALQALVNDVLDLSKLEAGRLELNNEPLDLRVLLEEVGIIFEQRCREKGLELRIEIAPGCPQAVILDLARLRQVLINLLGNAVKFTQEGFVRIAARAMPARDGEGRLDLEISVQDTGIGIPQKQKELVFQAYHQQRGQNSALYGGTGLGLNISRRLVELMGSVLTLESEAGKGSTFTIRFPHVEVAAAQMVSGEAERTSASDLVFEPATLLIVDDAFENRELLKACFKDKPFTLFEAGNGREALQQVEAHRPDVIIMDLRMPVMDGFEAIRLLKSEAQYRQIPILVLTASSLASGREITGRIGADAYLRKPAQFALLLRELARFLPHRVVSRKASHDFGEIQGGELAAEDSARIAEALPLLEGELAETWESVRHAYVFDEIDAFSDRVRTVGLTYHLTALIRWGEELKDQAARFDMKSLPGTLSRFPGLVESLRAYLPKADADRSAS